MRAENFYHQGNLELQRSLDTESLATHVAEKYVSSTLAPEHIKWISVADEVYMATVDTRGRPECSYKGGLPGFVKVLDPSRLEIPSYDGNGMYRTLGNIRVQPQVGLLFLFPERRAKLRVNGAAEVLLSRDALTGHVGAEAVVRVAVEEVFENCPRYLHSRSFLSHSVDCPREDHVPPDPEWKVKPEYDGIVRRTGR